MGTVIWVDQGLSAEVPLGHSLRDAAKAHEAPQGDACGGVCACSTCHVYIESGAEFLTEAEESEEDILDKAFDVRPSSRLGCQAVFKRDGVVRVRISPESLEAYYNEHPEARAKR